MSSTHTLTGEPAFRYKTIAALLALLLGIVGAQWWYLRRPWFWAVAVFSAVCLGLASLAPVWYDAPAFFLACLPVLAGVVHAAVLALMSNASFDRRYNPEHEPATCTRLPDVLIALVSVLAAGVLGMAVLAMVVVHVYARMGWLDGIVY